MASIRDIKRRKASIESTQQITKAMKLVSTVKLQRAKTRAEDAKAFFRKMYETIQSILSRCGSPDHPAVTDNGSPKKGVLVITSNRGLAGGYNNNVVRAVAGLDPVPENILVYGIGKKGIEGLSHRGFEIVSDESDIINEPLLSDAIEVGKTLYNAYLEGLIGEIWIAYTNFKNTVVHEPVLLKLLPIEPETDSRDREGKRAEGPMNFEPEDIEALDQLIPQYLNSIIYGAFIEAVASENGARMQAMDAATNNAQEMIAALSLAYNRARQGAITQELTEIISGAEALS
ncbi:MAG: ATP synthase F1 subunit gamma [Eubacterium sp.]|nr:ATP synthase F1 subunit gamma [Eubacterium sp.]